jgi:hypothetical protein
MKISVPRLPAMRSRQAIRRYRYAALVLAALISVGCSTQPMTLDQELTAGAVAGAIGAGSGAIFAAAASKSYPVSILIGAGGMAGFVLLYEEIKREAAEVSNTPPVPNPPNSTPPPAQNP